MITEAVSSAGEEATVLSESGGLISKAAHCVGESSPESIIDDISANLLERSASIQKYEDEWAQIFRNDDLDLGELRRRAILGNLRASRFRSVCWRCLLNVFSPDNSTWLLQLRQSREYYAELVGELFQQPWEPNHSKDHPLSSHSKSVWNQYFCDEELSAVIRQDVVRTFPGVEFFRKESIQCTMVNILFCYARKNPAMCYRQGMHEILAPLLFVIHCDHQALLHTKEQVEVDEVISEVLDPAYLEEDGFALFTKIMRGIESCYRINDWTPDATGYFPTKMNTHNENGPAENEVVAQLSWIRDHLLAPYDNQLHLHLQTLDIPLQLFGIRWLRLLFGREFPLQDLLVLWDAIFAEGHNFELVNYVVVAMLIAIRQQLLNGDYTTCLTYLMRYPAAVDITYIIEHALYLKDPSIHSLPAMTSFSNLVVGSRNHGSKSTNAVSDFTDPKKYIEAQGGGTLNRLKKLSNKTPRWSGKQKTLTNARGEGDTTIIDGFALDDPYVIRAEIQHAHEVMALCRLKLVQYHKVLKQYVYPANAIEAQQALDGVIELCSLLESRYRSQASPVVEVEAAYEAGEIRQRSQSIPKSMPLRNNAIQGQLSPHKSIIPLDVYSETEGTGKIVGAPLPNPIRGYAYYDNDDDDDERES